MGKPANPVLQPGLILNNKTFAQLLLCFSLKTGTVMYLFFYGKKLTTGITEVITFIISFTGVVIGNKFGNKYERKAQFAGGLILIFIGLKVLLEHLGVI